MDKYTKNRKNVIEINMKTKKLVQNIIKLLQKYFKTVKTLNV